MVDDRSTPLPPVEIRAVHDDAALIAAAERFMALGEAYPSAAARSEPIDHWLRLGRVHARYIAEAEHQVLGHVAVFEPTWPKLRALTNSDAWGGGFAELGRLFVLPEARQLGVGARLIAEAQRAFSRLVAGNDPLTAPRGARALAAAGFEYAHALVADETGVTYDQWRWVRGGS